MQAHRLAASAAALLALACPPALADRPFIATTSAAAEEDDDNVWSLAGWAMRDRRASEQGLAAEYAFHPRLATEFTFTRARPRGAGGETSLEAEAELKWLYNSIARDGWGIGVALALGAAKEGDAAWRGGSWQLTVPFSWQWSEAGGLLHLNAGLERERGGRRESFASAAVEVPLASRWVAFGEAAKGGDERLVHAGVRWWAKREKVALDLSAFQRRPQGARSASGVSVSFSVFDL